MSKVKFKNAKIAGISSVVPRKKQSIYEIGKDYFDEDFIEKINRTVGTEYLYFTEKNQSSGDLGLLAAENLISDLQWDKESIDAIIFMSQTPDFLVPPTSCRIQYDLGLSKDTFVIDTNYGCPGYPAGLILAYQMIATSQCERIIVINAECHHKYISRKDPDTALIFGDAATATAVEYTEVDTNTTFLSFTDGAHYKDLALGLYKEVPNDNITDRNNVYMSGEAVTMYMLKNIPKFCRQLLEEHECAIDEIDSFLFHQANAYMIRYISKRLKVELDKVPINISAYGNTSGPSIPLLICDKEKELFSSKSKKIMMIGFGAGFIINGAIMDLGNLSGGQITKI